MPLSVTKIAGLKPADRPRKVADELGLFLLVTPSGSKLWRFKYRFEGKEKLLSFGRYGDVPLDTPKGQTVIKGARELRDDARRLIAAGVDPAAKQKQERDERRGIGTFRAAATEWFEKQTHAWTEGHATTIRSRLDRDVLPYLKSRRLAEIDAPEILAVVRRVESRGAVESAHRILTIIGQVFAYAVAVGQCKHNPAAGIDRSAALKAPIVKPMAAVLKPTEVSALLRAIDDYRGTHVVRCAFKLAPLVFVRPGELRGAEWSEFDLDEAQWVIPAARMKLSKEAKADPMRSHIVPLSQQAVFILRGLQQLTGAGRFVFPGARSDGKPMSENAITAALRRMGYDGDTMSWHGFRSMASTLLNEHGYNPDAIESQLAHVPGNKVRGAYNRAKYLPERRTMMQAWADYLDSLRTGANVIPIRRNSSG